MGNRGLSASQVDGSSNVLMFGLSGAGKTHLMYTGLLSKSSADKNLKPSLGFNCEQVVGKWEQFNLWDVSGQPELLEFWPLYCQNIASEVLLFVVKTIDCVETIREAKNLLHELAKQQALQDSHLVLVFNAPQETPKSDLTHIQQVNQTYANAMGSTKEMDTGTEEQSESMFSHEQLERLFKVDKLPQKKKKNYQSFILDADDTSKCEKLFDDVSLIIRRRKRIQSKDQEKQQSSKGGQQQE